MQTRPLTRACDVEVGDRFTATTVPYLEVVHVEPIDTGIRISFRGRNTSEGACTYDYLWNEPIEFPRATRQTIDWRKEPEPPTPEQLEIGDVLPGPTGELNGTTGTDGEAQDVVSIKLNHNKYFPGKDKQGNRKERLRVYDVVTRQKYMSVTRRYQFIHGEPITFPRLYPAVARRGMSLGEPEWFGPYRNTRTEAIWMFTKHPTGRGKWPAAIKPYDPGARPEGPRGTSDQPYQGRFPAHTWDSDLEPLEAGLPIGDKRDFRPPRSETGLGFTHHSWKD